MVVNADQGLVRWLSSTVIWLATSMVRVPPITALLVLRRCSSRCTLMVIHAEL